MKYLLKMLLLSIVVTPVLLFYSLKALWLFNTYHLAETWEHYCIVMKQNYRKAFVYGRSSRRF